MKFNHPAMVLFVMLLHGSLITGTIAQQPEYGMANHTADHSLLTYFNNPVVFTAGNGFSLKNPQAITADDQGFLWIGGSEGLLRFDGRTFTEVPLCVNGPQEWQVRALYFDRQQQLLWIGTSGAGLLQLNLLTYECKSVFAGEGHGGKHIYWLHKEKEALWVGKSKGLAKLSLSQDTLINYTYAIGEEEKDQLNIDRVNIFMSHQKDIINDSILWIGSVSGLLRFNLTTHQFKRYYNNLIPNLTIGLNSIRTMYQLPGGDLLLGSWGGGVVRFDPASEQFSHPGNRKPEDAFSIIHDIFPGTADWLWVTSNGGIQALHTGTWKFGDRVENDLKSGRVFGVFYRDDSGRVYTGAWESFSVHDPLLQQFTRYEVPPELVADPTVGVKSIIQETDQKAFWMTLHGGKGVYRYQEATREWSVVPVPGLAEQENFYPVFHGRLRNDRHLILNSGPEFYRFDPGRKAIESFIIWPGEQVISGYFLEHSDGSYWFSTRDHGLIRWTSDEKIRYVRELQDPLFKNHYLSLTKLVEDSLQNVWISSITGYSVYDYRRDTFYNFPYVLQDSTTVIDLAQIVRDSSGVIWLLTEGYGLMKVSMEHPEQGVTFIYDGIKEKNIRMGCVDQKGNIWLYSERGMECFNPETLESHFFDNHYGLADQATNLGLLDDGRMYISFLHGFQLFHPDSLLQNNSVPTPYLSGFEIFDQPLAADGPLHQLKEVFLEPRENFFSIQFSNINFTLAQADSFAYQLEGVDPQWVYTKDRREVFYTNIASGDYTFKLRSANSEGVWIPVPVTLGIHIATPWWKTGWAVLLYVALVSYLLYVFYRFQLSRKLALAESERLREQKEWRNNFYTNITHEFRTPITVVLGMTDTIKEDIATTNRPKILHALDLIQRNGKQLLKLVNEMLDLAKVEHGKMETHFVRMDVIPFVKYISESFQTLAQAKQISLVVHSEIETLTMDVDREKMSVILSNLISNAIKFTPKNGKVSVHFQTREAENRSFFMLKVSDTGIGISVAEQEAVFERYYQANSNHESRLGGTGIGLTLTKELIELMGGQLQLNSRSGRGSEFIVQLPVTRAAPELNLPPFSVTSEGSASPYSSVSREEEQLGSEQPTVLIIEDNPDVAEYVQSCLLHRYAILYAPNGKQGVALAIEQIPDLIICDVMMPEMDGFAVCEMLKQDERTNHVPIVMLTARATVEDKVMGIRRGADAYLIKPFVKDELLAHLEQLLAIRATLQRKYSGELSGHRPDGPLPADPVDAFVAKAEGIILEHLDDHSFSSTKLAQQLYLSLSQTNRKIKALTGMSGSVYIRHVRLHRAKTLLADETLTVSEVAYRTGFSSPVYFSQSFKALFGESPTVFRENIL